MKRALGTLFGVFFLLVSVLSCVQSVVFDHAFYTDLYEKIDLPSSTGVSMEHLEEAIFMMTDYVEGKRDNLDGTVIWKGEERPTFNAKEQKHMVDVRTLWLNARTCMIVCWIGCIISLLFIFWLWRRDAFSVLLQGFLQALAVLLVVLAFFGLWALTDFTSFWTWFHTVFFAGNTDWLLNPATDFMIVICPEEMFSTMIGQCVLRLFMVIIPVPIVLAWLKKAAGRLSLTGGLSEKEKAEGEF